MGLSGSAAQTATVQLRRTNGNETCGADRLDRVLASPPVRGVLALTACCALLAGCGGGERQDHAEKSATYDLDVVSADFPKDQSISAPAELTIAVKNTGDNADAPISLSASTASLPRTTSPASRTRVSRSGSWPTPPTAADTAYDFTWTVGKLDAGATKSLTWRLTRVLLLGGTPRERSARAWLSARAGEAPGSVGIRDASGGVHPAAWARADLDKPRGACRAPRGAGALLPRAGRRRGPGLASRGRRACSPRWPAWRRPSPSPMAAGQAPGPLVPGSVAPPR